MAKRSSGARRGDDSPVAMGIAGSRRVETILFGNAITGTRCSVAIAFELPRGSSGVTRASTPMLIARFTILAEDRAECWFSIW